MRHRRWGFTLIELLVVVTIIVLLIALLLPSLGRARHAANLVKDASNQRQIILAVLGYTMENRGYCPPTVAQWTNSSPFYSWPHELNYHEKQMKNTLGPLIPDVSIFLSPFASKTQVQFQKMYETTYADSTLMCSYMMLWNYDGHQKQSQLFSPVKRITSAKPGSLLTQGVIIWTWVPDGTFISYYPAGPTAVDDPVYGHEPNWNLIGNLRAGPPADMPVNAGTVDGSVRLFRGSDTQEVLFDHISQGYTLSAYYVKPGR